MPSHKKDEGEARNVSIHWYRHGLRLHDNPSLLEALRDCDQFYPVFILDGEVAGTKTAGYNRWRFLLESLQDLDTSFKKYGGRLYVFHGDAVDVFRKLFDEWGVSKLTYEQDPEPIWQERDERVQALCMQRGVECVNKVSHNLWDPELICEKNGGTPPVTYMLFNQVARSTGLPDRPVQDPEFKGVDLPVHAEHDNKFKVPTLESLGIKPECEEQNKRVNNWVGGESKALSLYEQRIKVEEEAFKNNILLPNQSKVNLVGPPMSMSAHLRFGCMSIRKLYWGIQDTFQRVKGEEAPLSATAQLMWREYFYTMSLHNSRYNKMEGNPICLRIPWHKDEEKLQKWANGQTGYPWIDAMMNQLRHEGWIHQVARHASACFLTRGDLWLSWEDGLKVFDKLLLDADWSVCAGNWMWVSSSAFEEVLQCPRCFCPVRYAIRMDPKGEYVRRYVPVLADMPLKYLFQPWKAPLSAQEAANCIIGKDYPFPMVDHYKASIQNKNYMTEVKDLLRYEEDKPHCGPANRSEIGQFTFLPEFEDPVIRCLSSETCRALKIEGDD